MASTQRIEIRKLKELIIIFIIIIIILRTDREEIGAAGRTRVTPKTIRCFLLSSSVLLFSLLLMYYYLSDIQFSQFKKFNFQGATELYSIIKKRGVYPKRWLGEMTNEN